METLLNMKAIDIPQLRRTAKNLHYHNRGIPTYDIFMELLEARCNYLSRENLLFKKAA